MWLLLALPLLRAWLQPIHIPWLGIKPATLWFTGQHSIHWATPARAWSYFYCFLSFPFLGLICWFSLTSWKEYSECWFSAFFLFLYAFVVLYCSLSRTFVESQKFWKVIFCLSLSSKYFLHFHCDYFFNNVIKKYRILLNFQALGDFHVFVINFTHWSGNKLYISILWKFLETCFMGQYIVDFVICSLWF